jgi:uncharacterized membrane protein
MLASLLAQSESGYGWGGPFEPWEIHPVLNHLPIAFLLGSVALDLYASWRGRPSLVQVATGLLVTGVLTGLLAALSGVLAFFTVPAHTEEAHSLMFWHMGIQAAAMLLFIVVAWKRWRSWMLSPTVVVRFVGCFAAALLLVGSGIGGYIVYHGGAGIDPKLLAPEVRETHSHGDSDADHAPTSNHTH